MVCKLNMFGKENEKNRSDSANVQSEELEINKFHLFSMGKNEEYIF